MSLLMNLEKAIGSIPAQAFQCVFIILSLCLCGYFSRCFSYYNGPKICTLGWLETLNYHRVWMFDVCPVIDWQSTQGVLLCALFKSKLWLKEWITGSSHNKRSDQIRIYCKWFENVGIANHSLQQVAMISFLQILTKNFQAVISVCSALTLFLLQQPSPHTLLLITSSGTKRASLLLLLTKSYCPQ